MSTSTSSTPASVPLPDLAGASTGDLAFLDAERQWTSGGWPRQGRNHQRIPLDRWLDDQLTAQKLDEQTWIEKEQPGKLETGVCLVMAGRGWGKTKTGSEWVRRQAGLYPGCVIHVIAPTYSDLRGVIFEGPSGLKATIPQACIRSLTYSPYPELVLWNGSIIRGFSSEVPDRLRGPQATFVWGDEVSSWYRATECIANIDFSTRIAFRKADGTLIQPQKFYTTTPKPLQWLNELIKKRPRLIRGSTYENRRNLADDFFKEVAQYEGTQIGRQELHGELIDITESAIIKKSWLRMWPASEKLPWFEYIIVSMDTAFTEKTFDKKTFASDPTACSVWGVFKHEEKWNLLLLECWEDWLGFPQLVARAKREMKAVYGHKEEALFKPLVHDPRHKGYLHHQQKRPDLLVIEDKGSGISLRQVLDDQGQSSWPYNPGKADKVARVHAVSHLPHAKRIWVPEGRRKDKSTGKLVGTGNFADWTDILVEQVCTYSGPGTTPHDDHVDTTSQAWRVFADMFVSQGVDKLIPRDGFNTQAVPPDDPTTLVEDQQHDYIYKGEGTDNPLHTVRGGEPYVRGPYDG
jgi:phage terminase large subunit-like protein